MELLDRIMAYLQRTYRPTRPIRDPLQFFARGAALVSEGFTSDRPDLPKNYFNRPEYRSGYLLYFVAANLPKVQHCLRMIRPHERFAGADVVRMLDLGCGPGTAALAAAELWREMFATPHPLPVPPPKGEGTCSKGSNMSSLPLGGRDRERGPRLDILAIDQNRKILHDAQGLFDSGRYNNSTLRTAAHDITPRHPLPLPPPKGRGNDVEGGTQQFDIIVCANLVNEMGPLANRERLVTTLLAHHLSARGVLIIIEPALRQTTRELMELRDCLLPYARILAPCLHHAACPMLTHNQRDWCHAYLNWQRPKMIEEIDRLIGNKKDYLKFSYLVLQVPPLKKGDRGILHTDPTHTFRVVSAPLRSKGKIELLLCPADDHDTTKLLRLTRLDKDASPSNLKMEYVVRGDLITTTSTGRMTTADTLSVIDPFQRQSSKTLFPTA